MTDLKSRLLQIDHGDGGSQWLRNPDGAEAVKEIERLEKACTDWAAASQANYQRAKAAEAEVGRLRGALISIAHTTTEDSHGGIKDMSPSWYREKAHEALRGGDENGK